MCVCVCNIPMIRKCEIDIGNLKTRNFTKLVQVRNFYSPFEFKGFSTGGERNTIFLCWLQPTCGARNAQSHVASPSSESQPSSSEAGTQLTDFFLNPQNSQPTLPLHDVIHTTWSHFLSGVLFWHLWMTHLPSARMDTCAHVCMHWAERCYS